ncbi:cell division protein FtsQ/DivIB [Desulfomarina sp.]
MEMFSFLKKIVLSAVKGRNGERTVRTDELHIKGVPGEKGHNLNRKKTIFLKIKRWSIKRKIRSDYSRVSNRGRRRAAARTAAVLAAVPLFVAVGLFGSGFLADCLSGISFFQVERLVFSGNSVVTDNQLRELSGIIVHRTSLIGLDEDTVREKLLKNPHIASVNMKRKWPDSVVITVREHEPVAILQRTVSGSDKLVYIDKKGVPFLDVPVGGDVDYPVVTGVEEIEDAGDREKAFRNILTLLKFVRKNDPHLPVHSVSEVHVNRKGEMVIYLVEYPFPIYFGNGNTKDTKEKYINLVRCLRYLYSNRNRDERIAGIEYIRMDYLQDKVLVSRVNQVN